MKRHIIIAALALVALLGAAEAKNVDLSTLPNRDTVQLTIYNSEDITLVKETRYLTFRRGRTRLRDRCPRRGVEAHQVRQQGRLGQAERTDGLSTRGRTRARAWRVSALNASWGVVSIGMSGSNSLIFA